MREACQLFARKIAQPDVTIGITLTGALTPTGLGTAAIVPLIKAGLVDWVVSTGANLYHDMHRSLGFTLYGGSPFSDDVALREQKIIRIYDILFDQEVLLESDAFLRRCLAEPEFQKTMSTAELHYRLGRYTQAREKAIGTEFNGDHIGMARHRFVHRIVDDFCKEMMKRLLVGAADIHAGTTTNGLKPFEHFDRSGRIARFTGCSRGGAGAAFGFFVGFW
jgi:hypothetical protein